MATEQNTEKKTPKYTFAGPDDLTKYWKDPPATAIEARDADEKGLFAIVEPTGRSFLAWKVVMDAPVTTPVRAYPAKPTLRFGEFAPSGGHGKRTITSARVLKRKLQLAKWNEGDAAMLALYEKAMAQLEAELREENPDRAAPKSACPTVAEAWPHYLKKVKRDRPRSWEECESHFKNDINRKMGHLPVNKVESSHCMDLLEEMTTLDTVIELPAAEGEKPRLRTRATPAAANQTLITMRGFFRYCRLKGWRKHTDGTDLGNPCADIRPRDVGAKVNKVIRALTTAEIIEYWHGVERKSVLEGKLKRGQRRVSQGCDRRTVLGLRFILLVPDRSGELLLAQIGDFDFNRDGTAVWHVAPENRKGKPDTRDLMPVLDIFLPAFAADLVKEMISLLTPAKQKDATARVLPLSDGALSRALKRLIERKVVVFPGCPKTGKRRPTPHVLRHTFATRAPDLGVSAFDVDRCLDHVIPGTAGRYNANEYYPQRKDALVKWCAHVEGLVGGYAATPDNVVPLRPDAASTQAA